MKLDVLAQDLMDAYYQDYKSDEEFFDIDYFIRQVKYAYDKLIKDAYDKRRLELRGEGGRELMVSFDETWLQREVIDIKSTDKEIKLKHSIFSFPFDEGGVGVQEVVGIEYKCILARTRESNLYKLRYTPENSGVTFWYPKNPNIVGLLKTCGAGKVAVLYIPSISEDLDISDAMAFEVQTLALSYMNTAKEKTTIDTSRDGNPNKVPQSEINPDEINGSGK